MATLSASLFLSDAVVQGELSTGEKMLEAISKLQADRSPPHQPWDDRLRRVVGFTDEQAKHALKAVGY